MRSIAVGAVFATMVVACAGEADIEVTGAADGGSGGAGTGGTGIHIDAGGGGNKGDASTNCEAAKLTSQIVKLPLDLIIYLDSSTSMGTAISKVTASFDQSFSTVMDASGVDYQVIVIAKTMPIKNPANPAKYFFYPRGTGSGEIPMGFLNTFDTPPAASTPPLHGWSDWARPDAFKSLLAITDAGSGPNTTPAAFETALYVTKKFPGWGTLTDRNYRFHFMAGFEPKLPGAGAVEPWLPTEPLVTKTQCAGAGKYGQELAILTGALRFSMCEYEAYPSYFEALAEAEVDQIPIACQFPVPPGKDGEKIDTNTIELEFIESGTKSVIHQVHGDYECGSGGFYVTSGQIVLCPETCTQVQASNESSLTVNYGCDTTFVPL